MNKKGIIAIVVFILLILIGISIKLFLDNNNGKSLLDWNITTIYGAVGGGKENLLADPDFIRILKDKYKLNVVNDAWSNGKLIKDPVVRGDGSKYDFIFFSDQRFFDYYKLSPDPLKQEASREYVVKGALALNTPIVIYSWDIVTDALINEGIVTLSNGVYYISDMEKLIQYIVDGKTWADIGFNQIYGKINIASTDPVTSSPGTSYYGLLASIMNRGEVTEENLNGVLPRLDDFYKRSGFLNNTPADLFELYLRTGAGGKPMIVDYEKSIIDFANNNPSGWEAVKDRIRILYPAPTIWNSHCIAALDENGAKYLDAFNDKEIQDLAWEKYGFRVGITGGTYDVSRLTVQGIPQSIDSVVSPLKMNMYDEIQNSLRNQ
ncbi:MAG: hypothetical protein FWC47_05995 [Oscillospiraceae bacterium]|nr:hypothetical protein [Oscillospiraceae bacterium]